jgi:hypothetical protein
MAFEHCTFTTKIKFYPLLPTVFYKGRLGNKTSFCGFTYLSSGQGNLYFIFTPDIYMINKATWGK